MLSFLTSIQIFYISTAQSIRLCRVRSKICEAPVLQSAAEKKKKNKPILDLRVHKIA